MPKLSHQFPVAVVVVATVVVGGDVADVMAVVGVVVDVIFVDVVDVVVDNVVDVLHDANSIATSKKTKPNQINLFFNFLLLFYSPQT